MALFGGEVDIAKYGFLDATMAKSYVKSEKNEVRVTDPSRPRDLHDWDPIRAWALSLAQ
jgi:menaquinone-dependent protoporphyrinogen IX oxidase